jgi:2,5-diketo-D-gluconate reductase A
MPNASPLITLNDGRTIPQLGLGVWLASDEEARSAVRLAIEAGYRAIDTAAFYKNETGVGAGVRDSGLPREEVFITTKIWNSDQGEQHSRAALEKSLQRLGTDYVDLLLIHWPCPQQDTFVETWRSMIALQQEGQVRSIAVSNFNPSHLQRLIDETGVKPVLNQIELHPYMQQHALRKANAALGIHTESWAPLGRGKTLDDPVIATIASKHGKTAGQVIIRWHLENGLLVIPKSVNPERIHSNISVFDFSLDQEDLAAIATLERGLRIGPDPETFA